ncbi:MAG: lytic transglycosylase domain-containing protein, partial [Lentisphaerae bacterium]|nr:lytic transglycosylase domain-containing protein [Lentisphaerota bacterium]
VWRSRIAGRRPPSNAERYVPLLKPLFQAEGVPDALVWLAEVESSFRPEARSPVGALGLYQFMPATAERFGLALKPRDERLQPEASARAAAQYLRLLHRRFQSWPLALAAYNAGEGRVGRLLKRHNADSFEGIVQHLPAETRMYVPKVRAVVLARENTDLALW